VFFERGLDGIERDGTNDEDGHGELRMGDCGLERRLINSRSAIRNPQFPRSCARFPGFVFGTAG
jgi:hypothetical protein